MQARWHKCPAFPFLPDLNSNEFTDKCPVQCIINPNMSCTVFDLPPVKPLAEDYVREHNLSDRVDVVAGDSLLIRYLKQM